MKPVSTIKPTAVAAEGAGLAGKAVGLFLGISILLTGLPVFGTTDARDLSSGARLPGDGEAVLSAPLPLAFVANRGQLDPSVLFSVQQGKRSVFVGAGEVWLSSELSILSMRFVDASPTVRVEGRERLRGVANFYRGQDPKGWVEGVPTYGAVAQVGLYPGITHFYRSEDGGLKSELRVQPGGDPSRIRMSYSGVESLAIDADGTLVARAVDGEWRESAPVVFQLVDGRRLDVVSRFELLDDFQVGFELGDYDADHELIIDPSLYFSTYLGGNDSDGGIGIAVDDAGNVVVCGTTRSTDFPLENEVSSTNGGNIDLFLAKLDPTGSTLLYSTYLGGSGRELGGDVALDPEGNAYCAGWTDSADFPTTAGVYQPTFSGGGDDAAVVKLDPSGGLVYSTYLGSGGDDQPEDLAVDHNGQAYVLGNTSSASFPNTTGAIFGGVWDVFVTKLNSTASGLVYSTLLGGSGYDEPKGLALDAVGSAYVTGRTQSSNFPTTLGAYDTVYDGADTTFLTKFDPSGATLAYSTFLDGISPRFGQHQLDVAVDSSGSAYVALPTEGIGYPATSGAYDPTYNGDVDTVLMKVRSDGAGPLVYSTYLGGNGLDAPKGIAVSVDGTAYVTGFTNSADFPTVDPKLAVLAGGNDIFVSQLSPDGSLLTQSTYLGGTASDIGNGIALGVEGPCITGSSASTDFPTTAPSPFFPYQDTHGGGTTDAVVTCFDTPYTTDPCLPPPPDMVFWAPFDEQEGPVAADLVAGNNGTYMGMAAPTAGMVDRAIDLNDGYVVVPDAPELDFGTDDFTVDFWIEKASYPPLGGVVSKFDTSSNKGFEIFWDICLCIPSHAVLGISLNGTFDYFPFTISESDPLPWTHMVIVVRRADQEIDLYVNGAFYASTATAVLPGVSVDNDEPLVVGQGVVVSSDFSGKLDELELFDRALTASEALDLFAAGEDGKCKDGLGVPWDKRFCRNAGNVVVPVEVCNHSTVARNYELTFAPLPAGPHCSVAGPVDFEDATTMALPPLSLLVPAQSCVVQPVRVQRPVGLVAHNQVACFQVIRQDLASGATMVKSGSVQDKRNECWTYDLPVGWDTAVFSDFLVQGSDVNNGFTFELGNTTDSELTVRYRIEAMPERVLLNGQDAGVPVEGEEAVPAGGIVTIPLAVDNLASQPFEYDDIILSTDVDGSGDYVALTSVAVRAPLPTETVVANPDPSSTQVDTPVTIYVVSNDLSSASSLDLASLHVVSGPIHGSTSVHGNGSLTYEPPAGFVGSDALIYEICDLEGTCDTASVSLAIWRLTSLFGDGFESGDVSAWSRSVP